MHYGQKHGILVGGFMSDRNSFPALILDGKTSSYFDFEPPGVPTVQ